MVEVDTRSIVGTLAHASNVDKWDIGLESAPIMLSKQITAILLILENHPL